MSEEPIMELVLLAAQGKRHQFETDPGAAGTGEMPRV
jgi:hypothetical protein